MRNFWLFLNPKKYFHGCRFHSHDVIDQAVKEHFSIPRNGWLEPFILWKICEQKCINIGRDYFEHSKGVASLSWTIQVYTGVCPGFLPRVLFLWIYCYFREFYCYFCEFIVIFVNFILTFVNYFYVGEKLHTINFNYWIEIKHD